MNQDKNQQVQETLFSETANQDNAEVAEPERLKPWATKGWGYVSMYVTPEWVAVLTGSPTGRKKKKKHPYTRRQLRNASKLQIDKKLHGEGKKRWEVPGQTEKQVHRRARYKFWFLVWETILWSWLFIGKQAAKRWHGAVTTTESELPCLESS